MHGSNILAEVTQWNPKKQHCEGLMPALDNCMKLAGVTPSELDFIACTSGPGSFTGIRIGAAAAKGLAHAANIGIVAVPTLDALAYNAFSASQPIVPIIDARRGQVYTASYKWDGIRLSRTNEYDCVLLTDVLNNLDNTAANAIFVGDAAILSHEQLTTRGHFTAPENQAYVRASAVGALALTMLEGGCKPLHYNEFTPFYLRKPQAERELEEKSN